MDCVARHGGASDRDHTRQCWTPRSLTTGLVPSVRLKGRLDEACGLEQVGMDWDKSKR